MASTALTTLTSRLAAKLEMGDGAELVETLKATAFKGQVSDSQMTALLVVANQYGLNPWTKEIYAFPDRQNGIVPVVGVDGWSRIINNHPQFDGMEFEFDGDVSCTCVIYRKDRTRPVRVTEYMKECRRNGVGPWTSHPLRMLRHKSMIQCARLAFGYGGIYDTDEAERIVEATTPQAEPKFMGTVEVVQAAYPEDQFAANLPKWVEVMKSGRKSPDQIIAMANSKHPLTEDQKQRVRDAGALPAATGPTPAVIEQHLRDAQDIDSLNAAGDLINGISDTAENERLSAIYDERIGQLAQE